MKLNNEKNIVLCEKALYVKQLQFYAKMCGVYVNLAELSRPGIPPELIQQKYAKMLSYAANGDTEIIKNSKHSDNEKNLFLKYASYSTKLQDFKEASSILADSLTYSKSRREARIDQQAIKEFKDYMQNSSKSTNAFMEFIDAHTPTFVGHTYFVKANTARNAIIKIDPNHIPYNLSSDFTPSAFGSEIYGYKVPVKNVIEQSKELFDKNEAREYKNKPNNFVEGTHYIANSFALKAGQTFKGNKKNIRKAIAGTLLAATIMGASGVNHIQNINEFNNLDASTNIEQGYELNIQSSTLKELENIEKLIQDYQENSEMPTEDQLRNIRNRLDTSISTVISDQVIKAYLEKHPDATNIQVENSYNHYMNLYTSANSEPNPEEFINVTYTDKKGKEHKDLITNFSSVTILDKPLHTSFEDEYYLDKEADATIYDIYNNEETSFVDKSEAASQLLQKYQEILDRTKQLAGTEFNLKNDKIPFFSKTLKTDLPSKNKTKDNTMSVDDGDER